MNRNFITVFCCLSLGTVDCQPQLGEWISRMLGMTRNPSDAVKYRLVQERESLSEDSSGLRSRSADKMSHSYLYSSNEYQNHNSELQSRSGDHVMHPLERLEHLESLKPLKPLKPHEDHVTYPKPIASSSNDENGCICRCDCCPCCPCDPEEEFVYVDK